MTLVLITLRLITFPFDIDVPVEAPDVVYDVVVLPVLLVSVVPDTDVYVFVVFVDGEYVFVVCVVGVWLLIYVFV